MALRKNMSETTKSIMTATATAALGSLIGRGIYELSSAGIKSLSSQSKPIEIALPQEVKDMLKQ